MLCIYVSLCIYTMHWYYVKLLTYLFFPSYEICYVSNWYDGFDGKDTSLMPEIENHKFIINVQNDQGNDESPN